MSAAPTPAAPATAAAFRRHVTASVRRRLPAATVTFTGATRRFPGRASQPAGTVSFLAEVDVDGHACVATSFRHGSTGSGTLEVTPRDAWAVLS